MQATIGNPNIVSLFQHLDVRAIDGKFASILARESRASAVTYS
jgi:hypothetical protein